MRPEFLQINDTGGPAYFPGLMGPNGRLSALCGGSSKSSSSTATSTQATDQSLNAAAGATVVGSGGTLVNQSLDADVAAESLRTSEEVARAALSANVAAQADALRTTEELGRASIDAVTSGTAEALRFADEANRQSTDLSKLAVFTVGDVNRDSLDFAGRAVDTVAATTRDLSTEFALASGRAQRDVIDLTSQLGQITARTAESVTQTAVENLEKNKRDPDADTMQTVAKWAALAVAAVAALALAFRPAATTSTRRR